MQLDDIGRISFKGSFFLFLGKITSIVILAINTIFVGRFLGPEEYGIYAIALIIPNFLITLSDFGISISLMRFSANFRSQGKGKLTNKMIKTGILIKLLGSLFISIILLYYAEHIAIHVLNRSGVGHLIQIASLYMIGQSIMNSLRTTFIGLDEPEKSSLIINIQAITTIVFSIILIIQGKGVIGAIYGTSIGSLAGAISGIILFLLKSSPRLELMGVQDDKVEVFPIVRTMFVFGAPIYLSSIIITLKDQLKNMLLALHAPNITVGNFQIAVNFSFIITSLVFSISEGLFPSFSKLDIRQDRSDIETMFKLSVKYTSLIVIPVSLALAVLSRNVVNMLYGSQYITAPYYLSLYILIFLYTGMGRFIIDIIFNSQAETNTTFKINLINLVMLIPLLFTLIPLYGVTGLIASLLITQLLTTGYGLFLLHKTHKLHIEWVSFLKILVSSIISTVIVYVLINVTPFVNDVFNVFFGGVIFFSSFLVLAPIIGAVTEEDLNIFDTVLIGIPSIYKMGKFVLNFEQRIIERKFTFKSS